jgi:hypothetical protein
MELCLDEWYKLRMEHVSDGREEANFVMYEYGVNFCLVGSHVQSRLWIDQPRWCYLKGRAAVKDRINYLVGLICWIEVVGNRAIVQ